MAIKESILPEFDHEMATTRKLLERIPEQDAAWKPHAKPVPSIYGPSADEAV